MQALNSHQSLLNPSEAWWAELTARGNATALQLLQTELDQGRHQRSVYELFSEMEEKDGHLYSVLQTRLNGLLGLERRIIPAVPANHACLDAAAFVNHVLENIPRLDGFLRTLLDGIVKGFSIVELVWSYDPGGKLTIADWVVHPQEAFALDGDGGIFLLSPPFAPAGNETLVYTPRSAAIFPAQRAFPAPGRKFLLLRFGADVRNPYGRGLCQRAYWYYWFKKNTLKFWSVYNERYGAPTAIARYGPGTTDDEKRRLGDILAALQTDTGIVLPESVQIELLEQGRTGSADGYRQFLDWCNDEISRIVLGATLTSGEGRRSGSLALGRVHQLVRQDYIDADARLLEHVVNDTLIRWICEMNFGSATHAPRLRIDTDSPEDLGARIEVDRALLSIGVALPQSYFYRQYGRPAPREDERPLRFDDANFYGYHLQYGVLTINEVRRRLNLPPVSWGDERTSTTGQPPPGVTQSREDTGHQPV